MQRSTELWGAVSVSGFVITSNALQTFDPVIIKILIISINQTLFIKQINCRQCKMQFPTCSVHRLGYKATMW